MTIIEEIKAAAKDSFVPIVRDDTLDALIRLICKKKPQKILEIGTAVGYSGIKMLENSNATLTTIEKNEGRANEASKNFERSGLTNRVNLICGDAAEVLSDLTKKEEKFDLIFLDGPKGQYIKYLPFLKQLLLGGGTIFADNVGLLGLVEHSEKVNHKNRTMVRNMQAFLKQITEDEDFETQIFDIDDGYAICNKKQKNDRNI
ncbi:MAG: O-methyltransferase [Clostridia bacterium]|nr:O-methyltransferase [Clostridia bacterium]